MEKTNHRDLISILDLHISTCLYISIQLFQAIINVEKPVKKPNS